MEKINIGVYHVNNPTSVSGEKRLRYALEEAEKNNIRLVFFNDESIIFSQNMVDGVFFEDGKEKPIKCKIPEVIINPLPSNDMKRTNIERSLRKMSTFTSHGVAHKELVYERLIKSEDYKKYAIESVNVKTYEDIITSLDKYDRVVFKPVMGSQGNDILFIYREKNLLVVQDFKDRVRFSLDQFKLFIDERLIEGRYIVQPYIECLTKDKEPYDFRIHLHRNREGEWELVKAYPRVVSKKGILSNISKGGWTEDIDIFLKKEFPERPEEVREDLEKIAIDLANFINSFESYKINEIGVDLAIDSKGNYYTYELNGGPESKYHDKERATYVIDYALYLYREKIKEEVEGHLKYIGAENLKIEGKLLDRNFNDETYIGILTYPGEEEAVNKALGFVGLEYEVNVFYFYEPDIDYKNKSINGRVYNRSKLERRTFAYPDVIIDRLRMRGFEDFNRPYEEFSHIPFNIDRDGASVDKTYGYGLIKDKDLQKYIIPYLENPSLEDSLGFIEDHGEIIVKPNQGTKGYGITRIKKDGDKYSILEDNKRYDYGEEELIKKLEELYEKDYINQKYIDSRYKDNRPFDVRVHVAKDGQGQWSLVKTYAKVGGSNKLTSNSFGGGYVGKLEPVLDYKFKEKSEEVFNSLGDLGIKLAYEIDKNIEGNISEIGFDIGITDQADFYIYEINLNKPYCELFAWDLAYKMIDYAIYLAKENEKNKAMESGQEV